jgi:MFS transporter, MHS family, shikimate and dehydroshikimate transport protein
MLIGVLGSSAINLAVIPLFALLSDRVGRRPVYLAGAIGTVVVAFPVFWLIDTGSTFLIFLGLLLGGVANSAMYGPQAAFFAELFSAEVRYSGASLGYQIGAVLGGGLAPLVAAALYEATGTSASISAYLLVMGLITAVCAWVLRETHHQRDRSGSTSGSTERTDEVA